MQAYALRLEDREAPLGPLPDVVRKQRARRHDRPDSIHPALYPHRKKPFAGTNSIPWIFAAKTTASGLIALLVAFTFNLDQPYWALLTVFIVSQPLQSRQVLAKSLYRIIGTVIGAAVALLFVALFAQERVLFLGALALWIASAPSARNTPETLPPTALSCPVKPWQSSAFRARSTRVTPFTSPPGASPKSAWALSWQRRSTTLSCRARSAPSYGKP
jgi:hypothetical protein